MDLNGIALLFSLTIAGAGLGLVAGILLGVRFMEWYFADTEVIIKFAYGSAFGGLVAGALAGAATAELVLRKRG